MNSAIQIERDIADALRQQIPVKDLPGVSIRGVQEQPEQPFDIGFELRSGANRVLVLAEIRPAFSPRLLEEIAPWIQRLKSLRDDVAVAVIAPALSSQAQAFCMQNAIDFMDLAGNTFIISGQIHAATHWHEESRYCNAGVRRAENNQCLLGTILTHSASLIGETKNLEHH